jgi:predicted methyltransferase
LFSYTRSHHPEPLSRHPQQTIEFFGLKPGMRVAEVLPGGGWYTKILAPLVGVDGAIYAVNYDDEMWARFGFFNETQIAERIASSEQFAAKVNGFPGAEKVTAKGYAFGRIDSSLNDTIDAVVFFRALHHLSRFESAAGTFTTALTETYALLKPGGIVGVVQHRAPESADDKWANGDNGYLKQSYVINMFSQHGFELVASDEVNANLKDIPGPKDYVWRLPPSLRTSEENKAAMAEIGESDRMTLKFVKK